MIIGMAVNADRCLSHMIIGLTGNVDPYLALSFVQVLCVSYTQ